MTDYVTIPISQLPRPWQLKDFSVKFGDKVELPPFSEMNILIPRDATNNGFFVQALINGKNCWLSLDPITMLRCLSGASIIIKEYH